MLRVPICHALRCQAIVALSGAHTVGKCHLDRSGFDGPWTEDPLKFDNTYFSELMTKSYSAETTAKGCPQHRHSSGTIMLGPPVLFCSLRSLHFCPTSIVCDLRRAGKSCWLRWISCSPQIHCPSLPRKAHLRLGTAVGPGLQGPCGALR